MEKSIYITITGANNYFGKAPFKIGRAFKLEKEPDNSFDCEAIKVSHPLIGTVGYVANSIHTVYEGTHSAGRLYDKIGDTAFIEVMFITHSSVIARILSDDEAKEII
ncbi:MAG: hypothetical protein IJW86_09420 [Clostridia bacterium]|nr:hypothetical protein [Clostridia bacterium]